MNDIHVHLIPIRNPKFHEAVTVNEDGSYTVLINANMASNQIEKAYQHALWHIENNDFEKDDIQAIEHTAHNRR